MPSPHLKWNEPNNLPDDDESMLRYRNNTAFIIIKCCVQGYKCLAPFEAAAQLHTMLPAKGEPGYDTGAGNRMLLEVILKVAGQIPHAHTGQDLLASLFKQLLRSDRITLPPRVDHILEFYENSLQIYFDFMAGVERFNPSHFDPGRFVQLRAFIARLCANGSYDGHEWLISTMKTAFEDEDEEGKLVECYSGVLLGAAMFLIYAGQWVYREIAQGEKKDREEGQRQGVGKKYGGPVVGEERWKFWRDGFDNALMKMTGVPRICVRNALVIMISLDSIFGKTHE
ncbi:hypothetical protein BO94DRAFT_615597 [Aspergillus sclerotioniger CBS 115572]|uniref:Uncharacterized protein n=1 Tax=Aspergillus sclerotioniger CBS 115572 TaxID=1450535 RepID=A0A317X7U7_9EURO|nr:hypothetical protein BO94DRAFT_615597 [Aspergillus sclerotioniger CBS 115572]PWY92968.1 hypothetical protein BO94DRAFT_615597 [Aspergillus sclerotioniger CBS 115572]